MTGRLFKTAIAILACGALAVGFAGPAVANENNQILATQGGISSSEVQSVAAQLAAGNTVTVEIQGNAVNLGLNNGTLNATAAPTALPAAAPALPAANDTRSVWDYSLCASAVTTAVFVAGGIILAGVVAVATALGVDVIAFAGANISLAAAKKILENLPSGWYFIADLVEAHVCGA